MGPPSLIFKDSKMSTCIIFMKNGRPCLTIAKASCGLFGHNMSNANS